MPELVPISELNAMTALTGDEIIPGVQDGETGRTTTQRIADLAVPTAATIQPVLDQYDIADWSFTAANTSASGAARGITLTTLTDVFAWTAEDPTSAVRLLNARSVKDTTQALANRRGGVYSNDANVKRTYRRISGDATKGGFNFFSRFSFLVADDQQRAFCGLMEGVVPPGISATMNDIVNAIGVGKDEGDANLSIVRQGASGGATKTDLGITIASVQGKTLELSLTAAEGGTLIDYELHVVETDVTYTGSVSTGLPAVDAALYPIFWINSGAQNASMAVAVSRVSIWMNAA